MSKYEIQHPDACGDEWMEFEAAGPVEAAEQYAESYDSGGDYSLAKGETARIAVRHKGGGAVLWFDISGEAVMQYYVHYADPPAAKEPTADSLALAADYADIERRIAGGIATGDNEQRCPAYGPGSITDGATYNKDKS